MYKYKKLLVCLDLSDIDDTLIKSALAFSNENYADHIYFIHVVKEFVMPTGDDGEKLHEALPSDEQLLNRMKKEISGQFANSDCKVSLEIKEGNPSDQILKWAKIKEVDLIVLGKKKPGVGSGVHSDQVVNMAHCSVIFIPDLFFPTLNKIVLPIDFSAPSKLAFQKALEIARPKNASLTFIHAYEVPTGYHSTGKTYDEFAGIMKQNARKEYDLFVKTEDTNGLQVDVRLELDRHGQPDKLIEDLANEVGADLIIIGSKGRTALSSVLLGSVTVKVIKKITSVPLLVVKGKGENLGLLEAILEL